MEKNTGITIHREDRALTAGMIELKGMRFKAYHGCFGFEREQGGEYIVDFSAEQDSTVTYEGPCVDMLRASATDALEDTLNYAEIYAIVSDVMSRPSNLIEKVAGDIMTAVLDRYPELGNVIVSVTKVHPPIDGMEQGSAKYTLTSLA